MITCWASFDGFEIGLQREDLEEADLEIFFVYFFSFPLENISEFRSTAERVSGSLG